MFIKFTRFSGLALFLAILLSVSTHSNPILGTEDSRSQLSEISKLRAENFKLKLQLTQCEITSERSTLENLFKKELNAQESDQFDWNSLSISPPSSK